MSKELAKKYGVPIRYLEDPIRGRTGVINFWKTTLMDERNPGINPKTAEDLQRVATWIVKTYPEAVAKWRKWIIDQIEVDLSGGVIDFSVLPWERPLWESGDAKFNSVIKGRVSFPWETTS
ncbi:MAG: hypothetical protein M1120_02090 [Patescibacteria group bacterium]|nr:hypothetical protein [Patescibacteria group bacterium]